MNEFDKNMENIFDVKPTELVEIKKENLPRVISSDEPDLKQDLNDAYEQTKENLQKSQ